MDTDPHLFVQNFGGDEPLPEDFEQREKRALNEAVLLVLCIVVVGWFTLTFVGSVLRHFGIF